MLSHRIVLALWNLLLLPGWLAAAPPSPPTSVALHGERLVVGTERGLYLSGEEGWSLVLTRGGVRDLAVSDGHLLIAAGAGLYDWGPGAERPAPVSLGAGARVRAVASDGRQIQWVAAESGLYSRPRHSPTFRRETSLPAGAVASVRTSPAGVWVAMRGAIWRRSPPGAFERVLGGVEDGWWELRGAVDFAGASLLCVPRGLWKLEGAGARRLELGIGELRGFLRVGSTLWVASERGVYPYGEGRLESGIAEPAVQADAFDLLQSDGRLLVATRRGIATLSLGAAPDRVRAFSDVRATPEIGVLQRAVLAYLELSPHRIARIAERARRSAWLPQVRASLSFDRDRERDRKHDEVFSSGRVRNLFDSSSDRDRSIGLDLGFVWELARSAEPDQALDISRERRQLIELRDQVLERVNRLYFERVRVLMRVAALAPAAGAERRELLVRVRELAAHLDAWSGGAFTRLSSDALATRSPK